MSHAVDVASSVMVDLLIIAGVVAVPTVLVRTWLAARRRQLIIAELVDCTGHDGLAAAALGLTQQARQRVDSEIRVVAARREALHAALQGATRPKPSGRSAPAKVRRRLDTSLGELLSAVREVAPPVGQPAVQLLTMLVARPRGLQVTGVLQTRGRTGAPRLGLSLDVLDLAGHDSLGSQTFWEPESGEDPTPDDSLPERVIRLLRPAARWAAIQLVIQSVFHRGARGRERGLDRLLSGVLFAQSADAYEGDAGQVFRRRAVEDLQEAAETLQGSPLRRAALADTLDRLAAGSPERSTALYALAHAQYDRVVEAVARLQPAEPDLLRRYHIREATSWLASGLPGPRRTALRRLDATPPELGWQAGADELYDAACLYALAAQTEPGKPHLRETAARLLMRALAADPSPDRRLWSQAEHDGQLRTLHGQLTAWANALSKGLEGLPDPEAQRSYVDRLIERTLATTS